MEDGFLSQNSTSDLNVLKIVLNNLHSTIKLTVEPAKFGNISKTLIIIFLVFAVLLHENGCVETDIFHQETNTNDYLNYNSYHSNHIKRNIPINLAKSILVFVSGE